MNKTLINFLPDKSDKMLGRVMEIKRRKKFGSGRHCHMANKSKKEKKVMAKSNKKPEGDSSN